MKPLGEWDSAGWGFFGVSFVLCFIPLALWLPGVMIENEQSAMIPYVFASVIAVTAGGVITVIVNSLLQSRAARREEAEKAQKAAEKAAKKSKNKK